MEKINPIKLRICFKDENGEYPIKKILNDVDTKMGIAIIREELEKLNIINQEYVFLDGAHPIEKEAEKDFLLEDIIREENKIHIQKIMDTEEHKKINIQNQNALESLIEIKKENNYKNELVDVIKIKKELLKEVILLHVLEQGGQENQPFVVFIISEGTI